MEDISFFIAQIAAVLFLAVGVGYLFNSKHYRRMMTELVKDPASLYSSGPLAIVLGMFIIRYHNIWEADWTVLITLIGWIALIKGVLILAVPDFFVNKTRAALKIKNFEMLVGWICLILGLAFGYFGFLI